MAENEKLVKAMRDMKNDPQNKSGAFVDELFNISLITPVSINPQPKNGVVAPGSVISYITLHDGEKDKNFIMAFTDRDEYLKYFKAGSTQIMRHTYKELVSITMNHNRFDGFIIDAKGENVAVTREFMRRIAKATVGVDVQNEKLDLSTANAYNAADTVKEELKDTLTDYFAHTENIKACWLLFSKRQNEPEPVLVCVLDFDGDMRDTFSGVINAVKAKLDVGQTIGMISADDKIAAEAIKNIKPIYQK